MTDRDPFEEKVRTYQYDGRNQYRENDKSSRKSIRFRKAWVNRTYRRAVRQKLDPESSPEGVEDGVLRVARKRWRKYGDAPLAEVLESETEKSAARREALRRVRKSGRRGYRRW